MTKAEQIRALYANDWSVAEIAALIGCSDSYVRVCARQRLGGSMSVGDRRYVANTYAREGAHPSTVKYRKNPVHRAKTSAYSKARSKAHYQGLPIDQVRAAAREAYRQA